MNPLLPRIACAAAAGALHALSMAVPWNGQPAGWAQLLALAGLAWLLQEQPSARRSALLGWVFALAWLTGSFWWLFVSMHTYGGLAAPLAVVAVLALAAALALYHAAAAWAFVRWRPAGSLAAASLFAATWLLAELARGVWFTGFGWGASAYAHVDGLARSAAYVGAYGVGALVALIAFGLATWARSPLSRQGLQALAATMLLGALMHVVPEPRTQATGTLDVALLQGNVAQDEKFVPGGGIEDALDWYGARLRETRATLVVAPETAIPLLPRQLPPGYWPTLAEAFGAGDRAALVGMPLGSFERGYTNAVVALVPGQARDAEAGAAYRYDKHHLVPFGEFIPPLFRWFTDLMQIPLGDFRRGALGQPSFAWRGERLAPNICYEDLFGEELAARFTDPAQAPTLFVNLSNIAWFGRTVALDQHLQISRLRAIEFARPMLRATNTGPTAVIDHQARVTHALAPHVRGVLLAQVQGRSGITPYAWWASRFGLWPLWIGGVAVVALAWASAARRPQTPR